MPTLSEVRYNEQRSHILTAARVVFASKGFHKASIKDIMKEASVSNGAIFTYFKTKDAIILEIINQNLGVFCKRVDEIVESDERLSFDDVLIALLELVRQISLGPGRSMSLHVWSISMLDDLIASHTREHFDKIQNSLSCLVTKFKKRGELGGDVSAARAAKALFSILIPGYILQLTMLEGMDPKAYLKAHKALWM